MTTHSSHWRALGWTTDEIASRCVHADEAMASSFPGGGTRPAYAKKPSCRDARCPAAGTRRRRQGTAPRASSVPLRAPTAGNRVGCARSRSWHGRCSAGQRMDQGGSHVTHRKPPAVAAAVVAVVGLAVLWPSVASARPPHGRVGGAVVIGGFYSPYFYSPFLGPFGWGYGGGP